MVNHARMNIPGPLKFVGSRFLIVKKAFAVYILIFSLNIYTYENANNKSYEFIKGL